MTEIPINKDMAEQIANTDAVQKLLRDYAVLVMQRRILIILLFISGLANILWLVRG